MSEVLSNNRLRSAITNQAVKPQSHSPPQSPQGDRGWRTGTCAPRLLDLERKPSELKIDNVRGCKARKPDNGRF